MRFLGAMTRFFISFQLRKEPRCFTTGMILGPSHSSSREKSIQKRRMFLILYFSFTFYCWIVSNSKLTKWLYKAWKDFRNIKIFDNINKSFESKMRSVVGEVCVILGIPHTLEKPKKYHLVGKLFTVIFL